MRSKLSELSRGYPVDSQQLRRVPGTHFCWSFMVSMMLLSSRTCDLSSSTAAWLLTVASIFGFPSVLNRDGELGLCPAVPKEDDMGEDATETGPLLPAAMVPGLGGREALLSDTCEKGRWRGFRVSDLCMGCLPVLASQTFPYYPTHTSLSILYSLIHSSTSHLWPTWYRQTTTPGLSLCIKFH